MPVIAASPSAEVERYQNTITGTSGRRSGVYPLASCAVLLVFCNDNNIYRWLSESCAPVRFIHFLTTWKSVKPNRLLHKVVCRQLRHGDTGHLALFITITRCTVSAKPGNKTNIHRREVASSDGFIPSLAISQCTCLLICCCCVTWQTNSSLSMTVEDCWSLSFQAWNLPFLQILPTAAFPFLIRDWVHDSPDFYCYFWAYPFFTF